MCGTQPRQVEPTWAITSGGCGSLSRITVPRRRLQARSRRSIVVSRVATSEVAGVDSEGFGSVVRVRGIAFLVGRVIEGDSENVDKDTTGAKEPPVNFGTVAGQGWVITDFTESHCSSSSEGEAGVDAGVAVGLHAGGRVGGHGDDFDMNGSPRRDEHGRSGGEEFTRVGVIVADGSRFLVGTADKKWTVGSVEGKVSLENTSTGHADPRAPTEKVAIFAEENNPNTSFHAA